MEEARQEEGRFSRPRNPEAATIELRISGVPVELVNWLDAEWMARGMADRGPLVRQILQKWKEESEHYHTVHDGVLRRNPGRSESDGGSAA